MNLYLDKLGLGLALAFFLRRLELIWYFLFCHYVICRERNFRQLWRLDVPVTRVAEGPFDDVTAYAGNNWVKVDAVLEAPLLVLHFSLFTSQHH